MLHECHVKLLYTLFLLIPSFHYFNLLASTCLTCIQVEALFDSPLHVAAIQAAMSDPASVTATMEAPLSREEVAQREPKAILAGAVLNQAAFTPLTKAEAKPMPLPRPLLALDPLPRPLPLALEQFKLAAARLGFAKDANVAEPAHLAHDDLDKVFTDPMFEPLPKPMMPMTKPWGGAFPTRFGHSDHVGEHHEKQFHGKHHDMHHDEHHTTHRDEHHGAKVHKAEISNAMIVAEP